MAKSACNKFVYEVIGAPMSSKARTDMDWPRVALSEIATIVRNAVLPGEILGKENYVGLENITSGGEFKSVAAAGEANLKSNKFSFTDEHVLYGKLRPYLAKIIAPNFDGICSTDILPIRPSAKLDRRYLLFYLRTPEMVELAARHAVGINLPRLSPKALMSFVVPLPPIEEQRRIAAVLDVAETLRVRRHQALAMLDDLIDAVFVDMFGPSASVSDWPTVNLAEVCLAKGEYGANVPAVPFDGSRPRYLRITDIRADGMLTKEAVGPGGSEADWSSKALRSGDLVFARSGATVGKTFLVRDEDDPLVFAGYLIRFKPDQRRILPEYLYRYTRTERYRFWVASAATTVAQPNVNAGRYGQLELPLPPIDRQRRFVEVVDRIRLHRGKSELHSVELDALFASLQQRAFRGEL